MSFKDKVVLITGSNSGIGQDTALYFALQQAKVTIHGQSQDKIQQTLKLFEANNIPLGQIHHVQGSLENDGVLDKLVGETIEKFGRLDVLVNNAGVYEKPGDLDPTSIETFDHVCRINLRVPIQLTKLCIPHLLKQKGSSIINVSSVLAAKPNFAAHYYSMTKAALEHWTKAEALNLAPFGVRANCVALGCINTPFLSSERSSAPPHLMQAYKDALIWRTPQKRMGESRDASQAIAFLASDAANFITGAVLPVDGGFSCGLVPTNEFVKAMGQGQKEK